MTENFIALKSNLMWQKVLWIAMATFINNPQVVLEITFLLHAFRNIFCNRANKVYLFLTAFITI